MIDNGQNLGRLLVLIINCQKQKQCKKMFFNPCQCQCENGITRGQLVVIVRRYSPRKKTSLPVIGNYSKLLNVAMEPKHIQVQTHNLFKEKPLNSSENHHTERSQQNHNIKNHFLDQKKSVNSILIQQYLPNSSMINSQETAVDNKKANSKPLNEKMINFSEQDETQRKTLKNHNKIKPKIESHLDFASTTKRYKKKCSISYPQSPNLLKNSLPQIDEIQTKNIYDESNKQNQPNILIQIQNKDQPNKNKRNKTSQSMIRIMNEEICIMKSELKRLQDEQKSLLKQKSQNQKFFHEDYSINEKKKDNLKQNCQLRSQELKELKQLLAQCRNRNS